MTELSTSFEQHDLVWAKIQNYPWWPGKIIEIFEQKKSLIFKISFYADPTYSYLKEDALIPFQKFQQQLNQPYFIDQQLKKAIELANNAFQRKKASAFKKNTSSSNKTTILNPKFISQSQILDQNLQKQADQFQQSTIHADFQNETLQKDQIAQQKSQQFKNLLIHYKLNKIPSAPKKTISKQKQMKDQGEQIQSQSQSEDMNQDFQINKNPKSKSSKGRVFKKFIAKKRKVEYLTKQEKKVKFMKRLCSFLIEKQFQSSLSRQITFQVIRKFQEFQEKGCIHMKKTINQDQFYLKYLEILNRIENSLEKEEKLLFVFNSIEIAIDPQGRSEKFEQEKTQTPFVHLQMENIC